MSLIDKWKEDEWWINEYITEYPGEALDMNTTKKSFDGSQYGFLNLENVLIRWLVVFELEYGG